MSPLAELEIALRSRRAYAALEESHTQCSRLEDALGILKGREQISARWVARGPQQVAIRLDLAEMIAFTAHAEGLSWPGHRWAQFEAGRIIREVLIEDSGEVRRAPAERPPLGELRAGAGQLAAGCRAVLPPGFPEGARPLADRLHAAWNGRALDQFPADWLPGLLRIAPDAAFYFERACGGADRVALLWRCFGHHHSGRRIRVIGSSLFTMRPAGGFAHDETVMDRAATEAQLDRESLDFSR